MPVTEYIKRLSKFALVERTRTHLWTSGEMVVRHVPRSGWLEFVGDLETLLSEVERLRASLATARRDALEAAARVALGMADRCEETGRRIAADSDGAYSIGAEDEFAYAQVLRECHDRIRALAREESEHDR